MGCSLSSDGSLFAACTRIYKPKQHLYPHQPMPLPLLQGDPSTHPMALSWPAQELLESRSLTTTQLFADTNPCLDSFSSGIITIPLIRWRFCGLHKNLRACTNLICRHEPMPRPHLQVDPPTRPMAHSCPNQEILYRSLRISNTVSLPTPTTQASNSSPERSSHSSNGSFMACTRIRIRA